MGSHHVAEVILCHFQFCILLIFPVVLYATIVSHILSVPVITIIVETTPCLGSLCASTITQTADLLGLYLRSSISVCKRTVSRSSGIPCPVFDEIPIIGVSPHQSSGVSPYFARSCLMCSIFLPGLSILVIAIIIGTPDSFACQIDSIVCGITLSSAATTIIAIFVSLAHLALKLVNNSCPGVSMKHIFFPSYSTTEAQID